MAQSALTTELFPSSWSLTSPCPFHTKAVVSSAGYCPAQQASQPSGLLLALLLDSAFSSAVRPRSVPRDRPECTNGYQFIPTGREVAPVSSCAQKKHFPPLTALSILYIKRLPRVSPRMPTGVACIAFYHKPGGKRCIAIYLFAYLFIIQTGFFLIFFFL